MRKKVLYFSLFVVGYIVLAVTTMVFFVTWGAKRSILERIYVLFIGSPFDWSNSMWLLPLNSIIWAAFFYILVVSIRKLKTRKTH